jgi:glycosyltransferase involved in cell wall biosynthesis
VHNRQEWQITPSVSVVISTYTIERLNDVLRCISSLRRQTLSPCEIILVLDPSEALFQGYAARVPTDIKVTSSDKVGLSNARNVGIITAEGEIVAFVDDDAVADEKWLEHMVKLYKDPLVMGVGGSALASWEVRQPQWFPEELNWIVGCSYKGLPTKRSPIRNPIGCNMSFRKKVFKKVGYFRDDIGRFGTRLLSKEETELSIRVLKGIPDAKIIYEPQAIVYHKVSGKRASLKYIWIRSFYEGVSNGLIGPELKHTRVMSVEASYLKYLIRVAIPRRLAGIYRLKAAAQLLVLALSMSAVFAGFFSSKLKR